MTKILGGGVCMRSVRGSEIQQPPEAADRHEAHLTLTLAVLALPITIRSSQVFPASARIDKPVVAMRAVIEVPQGQRGRLPQGPFATLGACENSQVPEAQREAIRKRAKSGHGDPWERREHSQQYG